MLKKKKERIKHKRAKKKVSFWSKNGNMNKYKGHKSSGTSVRKRRGWEEDLEWRDNPPGADSVCLVAEDVI
jgi:hypothetical protein